ncbi:MAG TPA: hypothetical protein DCY06_02810 [Bacteroidetes bacterium]|nr:hypothetical protein [Bacteroidota bacterium]
MLNLNQNIKLSEGLNFVPVVPVESLPMLNLNQNINLSGGLNPNTAFELKNKSIGRTQPQYCI